MTLLLTTIMLWLSANFDLPPAHDLPQVEFVTTTQLAALRYSGVSAEHPNNLPAPDEGQTNVMAIYDDATRTIYLREGWTGSTSAELSVLVHEAVHHLQNQSGLKFECPQAREQLAYKAQERWLSLFGRDMMGEFDMDPMSILVRSKCFY